MKIKSKVKSQKEKAFIFAVGRRKESVARVRLYPGSSSITQDDKPLKKGDIIVNGKPIKEYFRNITSQALYLKPFELTNNLDKFRVTIKVVGGGLAGQLGAVVHGLSRALEKYDREKFRPILKKQGLLTRDSRKRQRRMVGMGGKSRRKKQSPKR